ncbi:hypothetical protein [Capnocytophaga sputigena]|uniref:hypothetical protein n=1 Tax=Capnocytophaga sputigena TaxID=1019 RepID=UPI0028E8C115|nr:hypothetical protein [Capnocytophaga sputigena]
MYKSLYFLLSHEFSPDGELFCEYIMLQSCKSMFYYIGLTLLNKTVRKVFFGGRLRGRLQNARTQHTAKAIGYQNNQLCQSCEPHGQETLAKYSDVKSNFRLFEQPYGFD